MQDDPYRSPELYDLEYAGMSRDIAYYQRIALARGGPILELGVGNGRVALPIARAGIEVHGVDRSEAMLADLRRKLASEPPAVQGRVRVLHGDFRRLSGPPRYRTVLWPFNTLHHCRSHRDLLDVLASVSRVLLPGGRLFLDCYLPDPQLLYGRDPQARYGETTFRLPRTGETLTSWEQSRYDPLRQIHAVTYVYRFPDGREERVHLDLRVFYPQELLGLVDLAGFDVVTQAAGFDGRPLTDDAVKWVAELRVRP